MALSPLGGSFNALGNLGAGTPAIPGIGFQAHNSSDVLALAGRAIALCQNLPPQFAHAIESYVQSFQALPAPNAVDVAAASSKLNATLQILARANAAIELRKVTNLNVDPTLYQQDGYTDPFNSLGAGYNGIPEASQLQVDAGFDNGVNSAYQAVVTQLGNLGVDSLMTTQNQVNVQSSLEAMINQSLLGL